MRKVVMLNRVSLDGYFAGPNGEIDWFIHDPAVDKAAHEVMNPDTLIMGRLTYEMFESYWPHVAKDPTAPAGAKKMSHELNEMHKIVFSKTLKEVSWVNTRLVHSDPVAEVAKLKQGDGADITIFGSGSIVQLLANAGLIDAYAIILTPTVLAEGKALFEDVKPLDFDVVDTRHFESGNVLVYYKVS